METQAAQNLAAVTTAADILVEIQAAQNPVAVTTAADALVETQAAQNLAAVTTVALTRVTPSAYVPASPSIEFIQDTSIRTRT